MAEGKSESKISYEQIADMGSGLIIARVPAECIREQDINARIMKNEKIGRASCRERVSSPV